MCCVWALKFISFFKDIHFYDLAVKISSLKDSIQYLSRGKIDGKLDLFYLFDLFSEEVWQYYDTALCIDVFFSLYQYIFCCWNSFYTRVSAHDSSMLNNIWATIISMTR